MTDRAPAKASEALAVAVAVAALHLVFRLSGSFLIGALNDDGVYVVLGKAIAEGSGYRSIHLAGAPLQVRFPPGLPLLLAVPWAVWGSVGAVRLTVAIANLAATGAAAGLIWWFGRRELGLSRWPLALCATAPLVLDPTIQYFNIPLTEPYLVAGWAAALVLVAPLCRAAGDAPPRLTRAGAVGLVLAATALFRSAGLALLPALPLALALHRRRREALACAGAMLLPLVVWEVVKAAWAGGAALSTQPDDLSYGTWLGLEGSLAVIPYVATTVATNTVAYVRRLAGYFLPGQGLGAALVVLAAGAAAVAGARRWRSQAPLVFSTTAATLLTLAWPFAQGRLLLPLLPFMGLLAAASLDDLRERASRRVRFALVVAAGLVAVAVTLRQFELRALAAQALETGAALRPEDRSPALILAARSRYIAEAAHWIRANTRPEEHVMVDATAGVFLYTGRRTVPVVPTESGLGPSAFAVPGRYLASRILADSVAVVVGLPAPPPLARDIEAVQAACAGVVRAVPGGLRLERDEPCLQRLAVAPR